MSLGPPPPWKHLADENSRARLNVLREATAPVLANNLLPHFTDHSVDHSDSVARLIDNLLENGTKTLTDQELLILYSACYLHDIGMQYEPAGETEAISSLNLLPPWNQQSDTNKRELLRAHHNRISAELVRKSVNSATPPIGIQLTSASNASYIACLCHAHCISPHTSEYNELLGDSPVRMRLLSALLRLADILDESRRRATREKARTLELDLGSQTHWWRHYYTEDVTFNHTDREITIHFDFPSGRLAEYNQVVPLLQMPQIDAEVECHTPILVKNGLGWSVRYESKCKPYSDVDEMPEAVLTAMLKQLAERRRAEDEERRLLALTQFQEARPSIERRLKALKDRESSMEPGAYLLELSSVAFDLFDLGGRRSARSVLYSRYLKDLQHLQLADRIRIGMQLLEAMVDDGQDIEAMQLIEKIAPSLHALPQEDDRKRKYALLEIRALISACAYSEAKAAIKSAMQCASPPEAAALAADLAEIELLQGDFDQNEET